MTHKIESPVGHPFELLLRGGFAAFDRVGREEIEEVEAFPFGQFVLLGPVGMELS
jgi:hypothetical protein